MFCIKIGVVAMASTAHMKCIPSNFSFLKLAVSMQTTSRECYHLLDIVSCILCRENDNFVICNTKVSVVLHKSIHNNAHSFLISFKTDFFYVYT
jgi:hypothetical protein